MNLNLPAFFDHVRATPFQGGLTQSQVDGMKVILAAFDRLAPLAPLEHLAYGLATTFHETGQKMQPVEEYGHGRGHTYGVAAGPWHVVYDGRGLVQITWEYNYKHATEKLREHGVIGADVDLERNPELALRPDIAAAILVLGMEEGWFTGKALRHYFNAQGNDPVGARHIINGSDRADMIAGYYRAFLIALKAAQVPALPRVEHFAGAAPSPSETRATPWPPNPAPKSQEAPMSNGANAALAEQAISAAATALGGPLGGLVSGIANEVIDTVTNKTHVVTGEPLPQPLPRPANSEPGVQLPSGNAQMASAIAAQIAPALVEQTKSWVASQTIWGGIFSLLSGAGVVGYGWYAKDPNLAIAGMTAASGGVNAIIGRMRATTTIGAKK